MKEKNFKFQQAHKTFFNMGSFFKILVVYSILEDLNHVTLV